MIDEMMNDLSQKVGRLALARKHHAELKTEFDQARAIFEAEHAALINREHYQREEVSVCEAAVREMAPRVFAALGEKTVCPGVKVRVGKKLEYDVGVATAWVSQWAPDLMALDVKAFEAWYKEQPGHYLHFVKEIETVTAAIDRDLSGWLPDITTER